MKSIRVIVVEDQSLERVGLPILIEKNIPECIVIAKACNGKEAIELINEQKPDLVFMDILMPELNGLEVLFRISKDNTFTKFIITSGLTDIEKVAQAFRVGADGYLLKHTVHTELKNAVETVMSNRTYLSPEIDKESLNELLSEMVKNKKDIFNVLTSRQREILQLIAESNKLGDMACKLLLSKNTVKTHQEQLMERLGIYDIPGLVRYAVKNNIITA